jgi:hypothetical protein
VALIADFFLSLHKVSSLHMIYSSIIIGISKDESENYTEVQIPQIRLDDRQ